MQRAATGLATVCLRLLGRGYGAGSCCWSAAATTAATRCSPAPLLAGRGARVTAVLLDPGPGAPGRARRAAAAPAAGWRRRPAPALDRADLVLDGMLGIGGRGGLRPDAAALARAGRRGAGADRSRSTSPAASTPTPARSRATAFPAHAHRDVRRGQARAGRGGGPRLRRARCTSSTSGWARTCRRRPPSSSTDADVAAPADPPSAGDDKYSQGVVGVVAGSADLSRRRRAVHRGRAAHPARAWSATRARRPTASAPPGRRRSSPTAGRADAGRVQAWVVGPGHGHRRRRPQRARRGAGHRPAGGGRRRRAHAARAASRSWSAAGRRPPC